jgi:hypothetical protein
MVHNIPKPDISPNCTVDDLHKLREWHYWCWKDATPEEEEAEQTRVWAWFDHEMAIRDAKKRATTYCAAENTKTEAVFA